jgi:hypothetical protein
MRSHLGIIRSYYGTDGTNITFVVLKLKKKAIELKKNHTGL